MNDRMKEVTQISLVHHWMEFFRGGEAVLEQFGLLFPESPISILVYNEKNLSDSLKKHEYHSSFLQHLPLIKPHFRKLLPLFPEIIRSLSVPKNARFVLSTDAAMIKGIRIPEGVPHVCYCHSPPRYLWGLEEAYLESSSHSNRLGKILFSAALPRLRAFDWRMAQRVDRFIANSRCVQDRIERCYGRESVVIHPPVSLERFNHLRPREDFYLIVSALVPYKCVQIAVDACTRLNRRLIVIGTGPEEADLRKRAGSCVTFLGWQSNASVQDHYERCRAFLFPGIEDFGITPCEAQASGAPVIAYGEGGALETVADEVSGVFFHDQTTEALVAAIRRFEEMPGFDPTVCRSNVLHLNATRFRSEIRDFLSCEYPNYFDDHTWPKEVAHSGELSPTYRQTVLPAVIQPTPEEKDSKAAIVAVDQKPLSVLQVVEPGNGGVFRHVEGLVNFLLASGVRVHLAYSDRRGSRPLVTLAEKVRRSGGEVVNLRVLNAPHPRDAIALIKLRRFINRVKPQVVHGHSSKAGVLSRMAARFGFGRAIVYTPHAYYGMSRELNDHKLTYNSVEAVLGCFGQTINISEDEARFARKTLRVSSARQHIVPNPVDAQRFQPPTAAQRREARQRFELGNDEIVIGFVGRMCWQKDPETAYHAILSVISRHPRVRFLHLGWGNWKEYLLGLVRERGLEKHVQIVDYMGDPMQFYHAIDGLLMTSRYEAGWPFVLLEAMACDLPVMASTCSGMADFGTAGLSHTYAFVPENKTACEEAIERWLEDRTLTRASNHREYTLTHFVPEVCFGAVLGLYRSMLAKAGDPKSKVTLAPRKVGVNKELLASKANAVRSGASR